MAVFVVDPQAAVALARREFTPDERREIFAPTLLRSQTLAICRNEVVEASMEPAEALDLAEHACRLPRRLLGDAVLRRTAWRLANEHGWPDTYDAEYIALTQLHGVALVAGSEGLREMAMPLVRVQTVKSFVEAA